MCIAFVDKTKKVSNRHCCWKSDLNSNLNMLPYDPIPMFPGFIQNEYFIHNELKRNCFHNVLRHHLKLLN